MTKYNSEPDGDPYEEYKLQRPDREADADHAYDLRRQRKLDASPDSQAPLINASNHPLTEDSQNEIQDLTLPRTNPIHSLLP